MLLYIPGVRMLTQIVFPPVNAGRFTTQCGNRTTRSERKAMTKMVCRYLPVLRQLYRVRLMAALVVLLSASEMLPASAQSKPPNVLLLFADDQRHDTIHALGNEAIITPNLDRLARRSFIF